VETGVNKVLVETLELQELEERQDLQVLQDLQDLPDHLDQLEKPARQGLLDHGVKQEVQGHPETVESQVRLAPPATLVHAGRQVPQVLQDLLVHPALQVLQGLQDLVERPESEEKQDLRELQAHRVPVVLLAHAEKQVQ